MKNSTSPDIIATNRKAQREYFILERFEAGVELKGHEIKSIRERRANLRDSFARVENGDIILYNLHISPYEYTRRQEIDPKRPRKLLLHKKEIDYLRGKISQKGLTLVPLTLYINRGLAKLELALVKGKKLYDKREAAKRKEAEREIKKGMR